MERPVCGRRSHLSPKVPTQVGDASRDGLREFKRLPIMIIGSFDQRSSGSRNGPLTKRIRAKGLLRNEVLYPGESLFNFVRFARGARGLSPATHGRNPGFHQPGASSALGAKRSRTVMLPSMVQLPTFPSKPPILGFALPGFRSRDSPAVSINGSQSVGLLLSTRTPRWARRWHGVLHERFGARAVPAIDPNCGKGKGKRASGTGRPLQIVEPGKPQCLSPWPGAEAWLPNRHRRNHDRRFVKARRHAAAPACRSAGERFPLEPGPVPCSQYCRARGRPETARLLSTPRVRS